MFGFELRLLRNGYIGNLCIMGFDALGKFAFFILKAFAMPDGPHITVT